MTLALGGGGGGHIPGKQHLPDRVGLNGAWKMSD